MAVDYTNDGVTIIHAMHRFLNSWSEKACEIRLEGFEKKAPSMMIQQLSSAVRKRKYVNGTYVGVWPFAVYIRINGTSTIGRLDAVTTLEQLSKWMSEKDSNKQYINLPKLPDNNTATKIEITSSPSIAARYDDGTEDYQAIFQLEYKHTEVNL